ncbi:MAG: tetratricopeptide repeat protein [Spartobacteria bacterium]|nr:tetratricopeptide repeat protein [Spartobacteria bacterium]
MNINILITVLTMALVFLTGPVIAQDSAIATPHTLFTEAGRAYDKGNMSDAIRHYQQLVDDGYIASELFFNLGNAYFRNAEPGKAIANYLRARQLAPRNADIKANLQFALEHSGALAPPDHILMKYIQLFTFPEWIGMAMISYWAAMLLIAFYLLTRKAGLTIRRLLIILAVVLAISIVGMARGISLRIHPLAVVTAPNQKALFAPLEGSTAHFPLPEGSIVRILDHQGAWLRISAGKQTGWLPQTACQSTFP